MGRCGEYNGRLSLEVLDDVIERLRAAGIFVMLDMHTIYFPEGNTGDWCAGRTAQGECDESLIFNAWSILARRYCHHPNVILADLFNEHVPPVPRTHMTGPWLCRIVAGSIREFTDVVRPNCPIAQAIRR
jgi:aryl-phospho-beta-D-glucosidase BglC (GH1 family)